MELAEQLLAAVKGIYDGLDVRVKEVNHTCSNGEISLTGNFYYLTFKAGEPTVDEFAKYVYHRIIPYCLPRKIRAEKDARYEQTKDPRYIHELTDQARNLFIKAKAVQSTSGEPGEVVLFILLEAILKAPQIASKMYLKTSEEMPVHGSDSVHLAVASSPGSIRLYWGESKLYEQLSAALDKICESISEFLNSQAGRAHRERDLDIVVDHMDIDDPSFKEQLLKYFDPYEKESLALEEAFACFVGFDYSGYKSLKEPDIEAQFEEAYKKRIESACALFCEKIKKGGLQKLTFHLFLLPLPSVEDFRKRFFSHLGVQNAS